MSGRIATSISDAELERRWAAVRALLAERQVDALVVQATNDWLGGNVKWLTDLPATNGYPRTVLFHADGPMTVVEMGPFGGRRALRGEDPVHRGVGLLLTTPSFPSIHYTIPYDADLALGELRARGVRRLGLATPGGFLAGFSARLREGLPDAEFVDLTEPLDALKAIKSAEERGLARAMARLQDETFAEVCRTLRPGLRDAEVAAHAQAAALRLRL